jgi:hypothetical protein
VKPDLERMLERAKDPLEWRDGDNLARAGRVAPSVVLFALDGVLESEAVTIVETAMERWITGSGCSVFWELSGLRSYSPEFRDRALGMVRKKSACIREAHVLAVSAPWTVRMGINLGNLILMGRLKSHSDHASFAAALTRAIGA